MLENKETDWWKAYFSDEWQRIFRYAKNETITADEADLVSYLLNNISAKTVLDAPAGEGRIALELAAQGFQMTGLEYNQNAVDVSKRLAKKANLGINFLQGDMRNMAFEQTFDAAICIFNSFGYFSETDNERYIASVSQALKKGGTFILEGHTLETLLPVFKSKDYWEFEDYTILEKRVFNYKTSRLESNWTVLHQEKKTTYKSSVRIYSYLELTNLMRKYDFHEFEAVDILGHNFEFGDDNMVLMAKKKRQ
ncbi:MAG: class I SAM-dependent methyltransferase [Chitinophagales bacterium]